MKSDENTNRYVEIYIEEKKRFNELHRYTDSEDLTSTPRFANPPLTEEEKAENLEREKKFDLMNDDATKEHLETILNELRSIPDLLTEKSSVPIVAEIEVAENEVDVDKMISKSLSDIRYASKTDVDIPKGNASIKVRKDPSFQNFHSVVRYARLPGDDRSVSDKRKHDDSFREVCIDEEMTLQPNSFDGLEKKRL